MLDSSVGKPLLTSKAPARSRIALKLSIFNHERRGNSVAAIRLNHALNAVMEVSKSRRRGQLPEVAVELPQEDHLITRRILTLSHAGDDRWDTSADFESPGARRVVFQLPILKDQGRGDATAGINLHHLLHPGANGFGGSA